MKGQVWGTSHFCPNQTNNPLEAQISCPESLPFLLAYLSHGKQVTIQITAKLPMHTWGYSSRTRPWQVIGQQFSSSLNLPSAAHVLFLCWTSLPEVHTLHEICVAQKETLTDSVQTSLFSITLASPTTFPISLSRDAKDSWACRGEKERKKERKERKKTTHTEEAQQLAKAEKQTPHLSKSTSDTGNHCSGGNLFYARFAQGTNTFAKIDMSPYNQRVACQPDCIWEQFYREGLIVSCQVVRQNLCSKFFCASTGRSPKA